MAVAMMASANAEGTPARAGQQQIMGNAAMLTPVQQRRRNITPQLPQRRVRVLAPGEGLPNGDLRAAMEGEDPAGAENGGDINQDKEDGSQQSATASLPPTREPSTLMSALKRIAAEQEEDREVFQDLSQQGFSKPATYHEYNDWLCCQTEPVVCLTMQAGSPYVVPLHSIKKYSAAGRYNDPHNGHLMGAIGDRDGSINPSFMSIKDDNLKWKEVKNVKDSGPEGELVTFYAVAENRTKLFKPEANDLVADGFWIPITPMVPASIGLEVARKPTTGWELVNLIRDYGVGRDEGVVKLLYPIGA